MNIKLVYASRYGSTAEIAGWIAQRLKEEKDTKVTLERADSATSEEGYDLVLLGSGIYNHRFLPELEEYIDKNFARLQEVHTALFGVVMKTEPVMFNGKAYGGLLNLEKYSAKLGKGCVAGAMLHGEMVYSQMSEEDQVGLDNFYKMIGLTDEQVSEKKGPRTLMNKSECWEFAERLLRTKG